MLGTSKIETNLNCQITKNKVIDIKNFVERFRISTTDTELIVKSESGFLQQGISEPVFYGDLVYKFKRIVEK